MVAVCDGSPFVSKSSKLSDPQGSNRFGSELSLTRVGADVDVDSDSVIGSVASPVTFGCVGSCCNVSAI